MPDADPQSDADLRRQGCTWCDNVEESYTCPTCRDGRCRAPKLRTRQWRLQVTPNSQFPLVDVSNLSFTAVNDCCDLMTVGLCSTWNTCESQYKYFDSDRIRYQIRSLIYRAITEEWVAFPFAGSCTCVIKVSPCEYRITYKRACVQGYAFQSELSSIKLYVSRTLPRYTCTPARCQYRLALVVEGRVAFSFGQTLIESFNRDVLRNGPGFCGATNVCSTASSGSPVTDPPSFNASLVPLTPVTWRRIYRRTVDDLTFPLTFSAANDVGSACGPMCAENISESIPSFNLTPPSFTCDEFLPVTDGCSGCWDESNQKSICDGNDATIGDCITDCPDLGSGTPGSGSINTIEDNSTTGIVGSGFPIDSRIVRLPDSFTVTLS